MNRLALALLLCLPLAARADEASRRAKAEQMVTLLGMDRTVTAVDDALIQQTTAITTQRAGGTLSADTQASLAAFQKKLLAFTETKIGWKTVEPEYTRLIADGFSDEELESLLAFYKSPAGKALLERMPGITQQASQLLRAKIAALQPQVMQMVADFEKTVPAAASPAPAPASPSPPPAATTPQAPAAPAAEKPAAKAPPQ